MRVLQSLDEDTGDIYLEIVAHSLEIILAEYAKRGVTEYKVYPPSNGVNSFYSIATLACRVQL